MSNSATAEIPVAIYARVSSDAQADEQTIDSQVAALRQRVVADCATLDDTNCFLDDGVSGSTLHRPALERLRDAAYVGSFKRLYVHSPDRLARKYEINDEQAVIVREVFEWVGRDRLSIGEVTRRLQSEGVKTATGKDWWDRTSVWGMLKNPAYYRCIGTDAYRFGGKRICQNKQVRTDKLEEAV